MRLSLPSFFFVAAAVAATLGGCLGSEAGTQLLSGSPDAAAAPRGDAARPGADAGPLSRADAGPLPRADAGHPPADATRGAATCAPCLTDGDCADGLCIQAGVDSVCAPPCGAGACPGGSACAQATGTDGAQVAVCLPGDGHCGAGMAGEPDAGTPAGATCGPLVGPEVAADCHACHAGTDCQANGCYGGWWCNTSVGRCQAPPAGCAGAVAFQGGDPVTGTVGAQGGTLSRLYFSVVGDTRPPTPDDTAGYPSDVIGTIFTDMEQLSPRPPFALSTGDYIFANVDGTEAAPQFDLYLAARQHYSGTLFPALGNHECTGYTRSNCGPGADDGQPQNYRLFLSRMLGPLGIRLPYYTFDVRAADATWTAKFVVTAPNAWDAAQATWLETQLARNTTYTFVIRHEPAAADTAPGVIPSQAIMARHPLTLAISGHTHTYRHSGAKEIIVGNGGAPATGGKNFGFAVVSQRADGTLRVDMVDFTTGQADSGFGFAIRPDGTSAP